MESYYSIDWLQTLVNVSKDELFEVSRASLRRNKADIIVANDLSDISPDQHIAYLVDEKSEGEG